MGQKRKQTRRQTLKWTECIAWRIRWVEGCQEHTIKEKCKGTCRDTKVNFHISNEDFCDKMWCHLLDRHQIIIHACSESTMDTVQHTLCQKPWKEIGTQFVKHLFSTIQFTSHVFAIKKYHNRNKQQWINGQDTEEYDSWETKTGKGKDEEMKMLKMGY